MAERIRAVIRAETKDGGAENRTKVIASTNELARDGHVVEPSGLKTANFLRTSAILFNHCSEHPIATPVSAALIDGGDRLEVELQWPPPGISPKADEVRGLVKAGVIRAVSIGFMPLEMEPLDPKDPWAGQHITEADLIELSFVGAPADTGAVVTQRSDKAADWKCGASRTLPIEDSDAWDGSDAESSIFSWAGGDDFDPAKARKGFLAYNASDPKKRGSYKLPIAHVTDGRLTVPKGAIRAAASRLPQADIPENVRSEARAVLDHYEEKAGMSKKSDGDDGRTATTTTTRAPRLTKQVADELGSALKHHDRAATHQQTLDRNLDAVDGHLQKAQDANEKARAAHAELGEAIEAAKNEPAKTSEHLDRAIKAHGTLERHQRAVRDAHSDLEGAHDDAEGAHDSVGRCMRAAQGCIQRAVGGDGAANGASGDQDDANSQGASKTVQTSDGVGTSQGSDNGRYSMDALRRRVSLIELTG